jgi:putative ABC transport system permease protein
MMSDEIDEAYTDSGFVDVVKIVGYIAFLAVTLACLGMLGMAMYATQTKVKEIGIRKVMGASSWEVVFLLSKAFLILIAIAAFIGTPLGYLMGDLFLDSYAYKSPISFGVLISGVAIMGILGALVIGSQTWKAAADNPVNALRYE